jgi:hypothetical protein
MGPGFWALIAFGLVCVAAGRGPGPIRPDLVLAQGAAGDRQPGPANPIRARSPAGQPALPVPTVAAVAPPASEGRAQLEGRVAASGDRPAAGAGRRRRRPGRRDPGRRRPHRAAVRRGAGRPGAGAAAVARPARPGRLAQDGAPTRAGLAAEFETWPAAPPSPPAIPAATPTSWPACATPCPASSRSARSARPRAQAPTPCWAAPRNC